MDKIAAQAADELNTMITSFDRDEHNTQIQAFGWQLRKWLVSHKLGEEGVHIHHSAVQPHPDNRDGEMIIPIGVWDLLLKILIKGFNWDECRLALCSGIPPSAEGATWKQKAVRLAEQSDGLLPPYQPELLTHATACGTHTTCVLRVVDACERMNITPPDDRFAKYCANGFLSKTIILEHCPSLSVPVKKGSKYFHVRHEIVNCSQPLMRLGGI